MTTPFILYVNRSADNKWYRYLPEHDSMEVIEKDAQGVEHVVCSDFRFFTLSELEEHATKNKRTLCVVSTNLALAVYVTPGNKELPEIHSELLHGYIASRKRNVPTHESITISPICKEMLVLDVMCSKHNWDTNRHGGAWLDIVYELYQLNMPNQGIKAVRRVTHIGGVEMDGTLHGHCFEFTLDWDENPLTETKHFAYLLAKQAAKLR